MPLFRSHRELSDQHISGAIRMVTTDQLFQLKSSLLETGDSKQKLPHDIKKKAASMQLCNCARFCFACWNWFDSSPISWMRTFNSGYYSTRNAPKPSGHAKRDHTWKAYVTPEALTGNGTCCIFFQDQTRKLLFNIFRKRKTREIAHRNAYGNHPRAMVINFSHTQFDASSRNFRARAGLHRVTAGSTTIFCLHLARFLYQNVSNNNVQIAGPLQVGIVTQIPSFQQKTLDKEGKHKAESAFPPRCFEHTRKI